jgi:hypothetical protein
MINQEFGIRDKSFYDSPPDKHRNGAGKGEEKWANC